MTDDYSLTFALNGGQNVSGILSAPEDMELEDVAAQVMATLSEPETACWMQLGNVVFFTRAVSAITVEAFLYDEDAEQETPA